MNWNEWRGFCSERELTQEETRESWKVYKESISEAEEAAIAGFVGNPTQDLPPFIPQGAYYTKQQEIPDFNDPLHTNEAFHPFLNDLLHLQNSLNESLSEEPEDETDGEKDTELIADAEESYNNFWTSFDAIKIRVQYYRGLADILEKEVEVMTDAMAGAIRGSL